MVIGEVDIRLGHGADSVVFSEVYTLLSDLTQPVSSTFPTRGSGGSPDQTRLR